MTERPHHAHWPARLPRTLEVPDTTLWFNLEVAAARYPDKAAYLYLGRAFTWRELHAQALALAGWLQAHGVRKGDRVPVFLQNCPQYVVAVHAILRADAVVVPVNPMNRADEFGHYITDPGARVVITSADLAGIVAQADAALPPAQRLQHVLVTRYADAMPTELDPEECPAGPILQWLQSDPPLPLASDAGGPPVSSVSSGTPEPEPRFSRWLAALAAGHAPGPHTAQPDDLALLPYTSGTTGLPKGCLHTHRTLMPNVVGGSLWGYASAESVTLGVVPMFHITGFMYGVLAPAWSGSTVVILPRWDRELAGRILS
ncbi:MAG: AMP-binding protein, partial [Rubrivivax sp.]